MCTVFAISLGNFAVQIKYQGQIVIFQLETNLIPIKAIFFFSSLLHEMI